LACEVGTLVALTVGVAAVAWLVGVVAAEVAVGAEVEVTGGVRVAASVSRAETVWYACVTSGSAASSARGRLQLARPVARITNKTSKRAKFIFMNFLL
jgi:phosphoribosylformimino-5-aminoimidazole carboxamide ribonucleotide (ProFAR) isomerase